MQAEGDGAGLAMMLQGAAARASRHIGARRSRENKDDDRYSNGLGVMMNMEKEADGA